MIPARLRRRGLCALVAACALVISSAAASPVVVHREEGMFGPVLVVEDGGLLALRFGSVRGVDQSLIDPDRPGALPMPYLRAAALGALLVERPRRALVIGLGGGSFAGFLHHQIPGIVVDGVEIDPVVVDVARTFFGLDQLPRLRVHVADGARFVAERLSQGYRGAYDIALLDAYTGDGIPAHLETPEFFAAVSGLLDPGGVAILNLGIDEPAEERRVKESFRRAFGSCLALRVLEDENVVLLGSGQPLPGAAALLAAAERLEAANQVPFPVSVIARSRGDCAQVHS
jgi:spermidine synthase